MKFHLMQFTCSSQALAWTLEGTRENTTVLVLELSWFLSAWCSQRGWPCAGGALEETPGQLLCGQKIQGPGFGKKKPSSVEGARQNFTFHSGKWGRILGI